MQHSIHNIQLTPLQQVTEAFNVAILTHARKRTKKNMAALIAAKATLDALEAA